VKVWAVFWKVLIWKCLMKISWCQHFQKEAWNKKWMISLNATLSLKRYWMKCFKCKTISLKQAWIGENMLNSIMKYQRSLNYSHFLAFTKCLITWLKSYLIKSNKELKLYKLKLVCFYHSSFIINRNQKKDLKQ
jgi:hypothetical protein